MHRKSKLPNLIIIGSPKCGTTSLYHYLSTHPEIFMTEQKELHFFLKNCSWGTWERGLAWYEANFEKADHQKIRGEASPGYSLEWFSESASRLIYDVVPDVKLVYIIRDPIERIKSELREKIYGGQLEPNTFLEQILNAGVDGPTRLSYYCKEFIYSSMYFRQLSYYLRFFPAENIHIMVTEDLKENPVENLRELFCFLGVDANYISPSIGQHFNKSDERRIRFIDTTKALKRIPYYSKISEMMPGAIREVYRNIISQKKDLSNQVALSPERIESLKDIFHGDVAHMKKLTGKKFSKWSV